MKLLDWLLVGASFAVTVAILVLLGAVVVVWTFLRSPAPLDYLPLGLALGGLAGMGGILKDPRH